MSRTQAAGAREKLVGAGIELFRRNGYVATTVDEICAEAGVTKGAFFHHFKSKDALGEACLEAWRGWGEALERGAPFQAIEDPVEKVLAYMDFFIGFFERPGIFKSCLAGTTVQEVSETHPGLREAAQGCFAAVEERLRSLLDAAGRKTRRRLDTASLARLWMATIQGSLVLAKASRDEAVIPANLRHVREYIRSRLQPASSR